MFRSPRRILVLSLLMISVLVSIQVLAFSQLSLSTKEDRLIIIPPDYCGSDVPPPHACRSPGCAEGTLLRISTDRTASIRIDTPEGVPVTNTLQLLYPRFTAPLPNTDYICFADDITQITFGK
ncbi:hypothetical protein FHG87_004354 [Trinorchestia longiramus]|nr:hypothetical protein FHG87_004354 [Trinorchestia longiramus]